MPNHDDEENTMILTTKNTDQGPLPTEGMHEARLYDIRDLGMVDTQHGPKHKILLSFQIDDQDGDVAVHARYNATLHRKSKLYPVVCALLGRQFEGQLDSESLIGKSCRLVIEHVTIEDGRTFANIVKVMRDFAVAS